MNKNYDVEITYEKYIYKDGQLKSNDGYIVTDGSYYEPKYGHKCEFDINEFNIAKFEHEYNFENEDVYLIRVTGEKININFLYWDNPSKINKNDYIFGDSTKFELPDSFNSLDMEYKTIGFTEFVSGKNTDGTGFEINECCVIAAYHDCCLHDLKLVNQCGIEMYSPSTLFNIGMFFEHFYDWNIKSIKEFKY